MIQKHTAEFVLVTDLVPTAWRNWFWELISEGAPFSWGDANRTLITASSFADHCEKRLLDSEGTSASAKTKFLRAVRALGETYIDLEN